MPNYLEFDSKLNFITIIIPNTYISFRLQYSGLCVGLLNWPSEAH